MVEEQAIVYAPQWNNMTMDNSTIVAYDPFPSTDETEKRPLRKFLIKFSVLNRQRPLTLDFNTFCSSTGLDYNNGIYVAHPAPEAVLGGNYSSTEQVNSIQQLLAYYLIIGTEVDIGEIIYSDLVTKLLNKSRLKYVSYPTFISCALQVLLSSDYTQDENFGFLLGILSNSNFTKDPSKVTDIELTANMIVVNNQRNLVSPPHFSRKKKKGKSQTVTSTLPQSQGPKASGALSKKRQKPKSKKPPIETKVTPPKPTEGSEQSHLVSLGTVPDPHDLERNKQLASTGLPSTLDEGTRKSQPLPESTTIDPKDLVGNKQPINTGLTSMTSDEGTAKTMPRPERSLGDKDSGGNKPPVDMEPINPTIVDPSGTGAKYQVDQTQSTRLSDEDILGAGKEMDEDPLTASMLKTLPSVLLPQGRNKASIIFAPSFEKKHQGDAVNYANLKASIDEYYDENIAHRNQTDKIVEAFMSSLDKSSTIISDLYKDLNIITELLKEINNAVKDYPAHALKQDEELAAWAKSSTNMAWNLGSILLGQSLGSVTPKLALTHIPANVEGENDTNTATEDPLSHSEGETDANRQEKSEDPNHSTDTNIEFIGSSKPQPSITQAQPNTIFNPEPIIL
ncbi:hypothetical protein Tco_1202933 [Tanacetum coccineum]